MTIKTHLHPLVILALEGGGVIVADCSDAPIYAGTLAGALAYVGEKLTPPPPEPSEGRKAVDAAIETLRAVGVVFTKAEPDEPDAGPWPRAVH